MKAWITITKSPQETMALAEQLGKKVQSGDVIALSGDLGAGKTSFTKGLAKGLRVSDMVNSPTFTIIKEYEGRLPLYHMDVYRIEEESEDLGLDEYFYGEGVSVVEWANLISSQLPADRLMVEIYHRGENTRELRITPSGTRSHYLWKG